MSDSLQIMKNDSVRCVNQTRQVRFIILLQVKCGQKNNALTIRNNELIKYCNVRKDMVKMHLFIDTVVMHRSSNNRGLSFLLS
jgi:hypothetical protein